MKSTMDASEYAKYRHAKQKFVYDLNQRCGTTDCCRQFRISVSLASRAKHKCLGHYCQCAQRTTQCSLQQGDRYTVKFCAVVI